MVFAIFRHSILPYGLDYARSRLTPIPSEAEQGYFNSQGIRTGRQPGRVVAPHYDEVVVDRLFAGHVQLTTALQPLIEATEQTLRVDGCTKSANSDPHGCRRRLA